MEPRGRATGPGWPPPKVNFRTSPAKVNFDRVSRKVNSPDRAPPCRMH